MPSVLCKEVLANLPELKSLKMDNVEAFNEEMFKDVMKKLCVYKGLKKLCLELLCFDLNSHVDLLVEVINTHGASLNYLSFSKNKIADDFMEKLCFRIAAESRINYIDLKHLKEAKNVDFVALLRNLAKTTMNKDHLLTVSLSGYQTFLKQGEISNVKKRRNLFRVLVETRSLVQDLRECLVPNGWKEVTNNLE